MPSQKDLIFNKIKDLVLGLEKTGHLYKTINELHNLHNHISYNDLLNFFEEENILDNSYAQYFLAFVLGYNIYRFGIDPELGLGRLKSKNDFNIICKWIEKSSLQNNSDALYFLGRMNESGEFDCASHTQKSMEYFIKSYNLGNSSACARLGFFYQEKNDIELAIKYYNEGMQKNNPYCISMIASLQENKVQYIKFIRIALSYGLDYKETLNDLINMYGVTIIDAFIQEENKNKELEKNLLDLQNKIQKLEKQIEEYVHAPLGAGGKKYLEALNNFTNTCQQINKQ